MDLLLCTALALVGSYFLYTRTFISLATRLRNWRYFYQRGARFLWLGSLIHRMRENARFFYFLSMTMMFSLGIAGTAATFYNAVGNLPGFAPKKSFFPLIYQESATNPSRTPQGKKAVTRWLQTHMDRWQDLPFSEIHIDKHDTIISSSAYQQLAQVLGLQPLPTLEPWEAVFVYYNEAAPTRGAFYANENDAPYPPFSDASSLSPPQGARKIRFLHLPQPLYQTDQLERQLWITGSALYKQWLAKAYKFSSSGHKANVQDTISAGAKSRPQIRLYHNTGYYFDVSPLSMQQVRQLLSLEYPSPSFPKTLSPVKEEGRENHLSSSYTGTLKMDLRLHIQYAVQHILPLFLLFLIATASAFGCISGNFLLSRVYTEIQNNRYQYRKWLNLGVSWHQLRRSLTTQMSILFFLPLLPAVILTLSAFAYLAKIFDHIPNLKGPVWSPCLYVVATFMIVEILIFFSIRTWLLCLLKRTVAK